MLALAAAAADPCPGGPEPGWLLVIGYAEGSDPEVGVAEARARARHALLERACARFHPSLCLLVEAAVEDRGPGALEDGVACATVALSLHTLPAPLGDLAGCDPAEVRRRSGELRRLAGRGRWDGVEREYAQVAASTCAIDPTLHALGAQAAAERGDGDGRRERLTLAASDHGPSRAALHALLTGWGELDVRGAPGRVLSMDPMPFPPDERRAVERAVAAVHDVGTFSGLVPAGTYRVDGVPTVVSPVLVQQ